LRWKVTCFGFTCEQEAASQDPRLQTNSCLQTTFFPASTLSATSLSTADALRATTLMSAALPRLAFACTAKPHNHGKRTCRFFTSTLFPHRTMGMFSQTLQADRLHVTQVKCSSFAGVEPNTYALRGDEMYGHVQAGSCR
jgi:hypothetical protein